MTEQQDDFRLSRKDKEYLDSLNLNALQRQRVEDRARQDRISAERALLLLQAEDVEDAKK
jgi:hypothetical protein